MNRLQDMALRKVLDTTLEKLRSMEHSEKSSFLKWPVFKRLEATLCRGINHSCITDDTYVLIDKLCVELSLMKTSDLSGDDFKMIEHIQLDGIDFNRLSDGTLMTIYYVWPYNTDAIHSKLENTKSFFCGACDEDIVTCEGRCYLESDGWYDDDDCVGRCSELCRDCDSRYCEGDCGVGRFLRESMMMTFGTCK